MAITRIKNSSILNGTPKYNDFQAGLPYRPIIGTATDGGNGTSVSVAFTGNNVANGTITYTALSSPGSFTGTGTASPITVSGLTSGTEYTFQVKAGNSLGDSAYSAASNAVTPVTPTAFESIATATATGSSNTITFSSIPSTYQHLQLRFNITSMWIYGSFRLYANGAPTGTSGHWLEAGGGSIGAGYTSALFQMSGNQVNSTGTTYPNVGIIDLHDYAITSKNKTMRAFVGSDSNGSGFVNLSSGLYPQTTAISSLTFTDGGGGTFTGSFALYGIRGA